MQKTKAYINCSHPERNEWSHITAKNKHMIEQWTLVSPSSLPCSWHTSYVISTHPSAQHQLAAYRISTLESCVVHQFSVGFLQTILLYSFFFSPSSTPCWFPSFSPASHNYFSCFVLLKFCRGGTKCWWISQFLRCLPAFGAFLRWHFESRFY